jgi:hypothetical protein
LTQLEIAEIVDEARVVLQPAPAMALTDPHIVRTADGKMFRCVVEPKIGAAGEDRWVFTDTDGTRYVGPSYTAIPRERELRGIVMNWWAKERSLGQ